MAAGNFIAVRGKISKYSYIPIVLKKGLVRFGVNCNRERQVVGKLRRLSVTILVDKIFLVSST